MTAQSMIFVVTKFSAEQRSQRLEVKFSVNKKYFCWKIVKKTSREKIFE